jgi:hypothetical protein
MDRYDVLPGAGPDHCSGRSDAPGTGPGTVRGHRSHPPPPARQAYGNRHTRPGPANAPADAPGSAPAAPEPSASVPAPAPAPAPVQDASQPRQPSAPVAAAADGYSLVIEAQDYTWIRLSEDQSQPSGPAETGGKAVATGIALFRYRCGKRRRNPVDLSGKNPGPPGSPGTGRTPSASLKPFER